jgi:phage shock protein PspC (stress-responsive transcriptional regulator)
MEAHEAHELQEHAEHGAHESAMRPVAFTMAVLAAVVAITTVLGHRTHTEAVLTQNKATDQWNLYQAKNIRSTDTELASEELRVVGLADKEGAQQILKAHADKQAKWKNDLKEEEEKARELEADVARAEGRANRFDIGETLLEIGLVVTSITLLTKSRIYWYFGLAFALAGISAAASAYFIR